MILEGVEIFALNFWLKSEYSWRLRMPGFDDQIIFQNISPKLKIFEDPFKSENFLKEASSWEPFLRCKFSVWNSKNVKILRRSSVLRIIRPE